MRHDHLNQPPLVLVERILFRRVERQHADNLIKQPGSLPQFEVASNPRQNFTAGDFFAPHLDLGTLNASYAITEHLTLQGNAFVRSLSSEQFNVNLIADSTRLRNETLSTGGKLQASHRTTIFGRDNMVVVGGEYTRSSVTSRTFEEGADGQALTASVKDTQGAVGAYAQDSFTLLQGFLGKGSSMILTAAGRWDYLRHDIDDRLDKRLGVFLRQVVADAAAEIAVLIAAAELAGV